MRNTFLITLLCLCVGVYCQTDTLLTVRNLDEVVVSARRAQLQSEALRVVTHISGDALHALPVSSVSELLDYLPGVDIRGRGAGGTQADITMRGGSFDQVLVLLNGINLTDPHTGHYNLDLPIDINAVDRVEILQGTGMNLFGLNAFAGAVNIITKPLESGAKNTERAATPPLAGEVPEGQRGRTIEQGTKTIEQERVTPPALRATSPFCDRGGAADAHSSETGTKKQEQGTKNKESGAQNKERAATPPLAGEVPEGQRGRTIEQEAQTIEQGTKSNEQGTKSNEQGTRATSYNLRLRMTAGAHKYFNPAVSAKVRHGIWWLNTMAEHNQSGGYIHNTAYHISNMFLHSGWDDDSRSGNWQLQFGGQLKDYGANAFYSLKYPEQYETTKTMFASVRWNKTLGRFALGASAYWRTHYDCFELIHDREQWPTWYTGHNYHVTHIAAANIQGSYHSRIGKTSVGVEIRDEYIKSNVLGDPLDTPLQVPFGADTTFIYAKNRLNINYFAEQVFYYKGLSASVGFAGNYNTTFGNNFSFGANLGYEFVRGGSVYANVSRSLRLPTFTDLYYKSATQIANPDLKPEKSITAELGVKYADSHWTAQLTGYYRHGTDIIDWVKAPEQEQWRSMNHTVVNAMGGEVLAAWHQGYWVKTLQVSYAFTHLDKDPGTLLSKYALDYLRHKVSVKLEHGIYKGFGATWVYTMQSRHGDYTDRDGNVVSYKPFWTLDGKIYWQSKHTELFLEATNIFAADYYDYGGLPQPGRWIKAGVVVKLQNI